MDDHEAFSPKAAAFMSQVAAEKVKAQVPAVVIVECIYVMEKYYKIPREEIADTLSKLLNLKGIVNPDRAEILEALVHFKDSKADIVDCILAALSSPQQIVVSFDRDLENLNATTQPL
jgi:predicted nucleic-acid-binding protein